MSPVFDKVYEDAYRPFSEDKISLETALDRGTAPLRTFMLGQTRETTRHCLPVSPKWVKFRKPKMPMRILIPPLSPVS